MDEKFIARFLNAIKPHEPDKNVWVKLDRLRKKKKRTLPPDEWAAVRPTFNRLRRELKTYFERRRVLQTAGFSAGRDSIKKPVRAEVAFAVERRQDFFFKRIKSTYGLSKTDYLRMLTDQDSRCLCCDKILVLFSSDRSVHPVVDHCHATGKVRALLCSGCNTLVGRVESKSEAVARAMRFLARNGVLDGQSGDT